MDGAEAYFCVYHTYVCMHYIPPPFIFKYLGSFLTGTQGSKGGTFRLVRRAEEHPGRAPV